MDAPITTLISGRGEEGRFTLEAAIIFPAFILIIMALVYMGAVLYQYLVIKSVVDYSAERAAETWDSGLEGFARSASEPGVGNALYSRLFDNDCHSKKGEVSRYVAEEIKKRSIFKELETCITVELIDCLFFRSVIVQAKTNFNTPVGNFDFSADAESVIKDPAELIRNMDLVLDVKKEIEEKYPGMGGGAGKMAERMKKALESIFPKED